MVICGVTGITVQPPLTGARPRSRSGWLPGASGSDAICVDGPSRRTHGGRRPWHVPETPATRALTPARPAERGSTRRAPVPDEGKLRESARGSAPWPDRWTHLAVEPPGHPDPGNR